MSERASPGNWQLSYRDGVKMVVDAVFQNLFVKLKGTNLRAFTVLRDFVYFWAIIQFYLEPIILLTLNIFYIFRLTGLFEKFFKPEKRNP